MAKWCRKPKFGQMTGWLIAAGVVVAFAAVAQALVSGGGVWRDPRTGLAIGGYDPVAYFVALEPRVGRRDHELDLDGVAWRFESAANRAVFERDPLVYAPQFGGHDPIKLAGDFLTAGNPRLWMVIEDRLYFFASDEARQRWRVAEQSLRAQAVVNWPKLAQKPR